MSAKDFPKDSKENEGVGYAIMVKPKKEEIDSPTLIPTEVKKIVMGRLLLYHLRGP